MPVKCANARKNGQRFPGALLEERRVLKERLVRSLPPAVHLHQDFEVAVDPRVHERGAGANAFEAQVHAGVAHTQSG